MFLNNEEKLSSGKRLHIGRMNKIWSHTRNSISIRNLKMESQNSSFFFTEARLDRIGSTLGLREVSLPEGWNVNIQTILWFCNSQSFHILGSCWSPSTLPLLFSGHFVSSHPHLPGPGDLSTEQVTHFPKSEHWQQQSNGSQRCSRAELGAGMGNSSTWSSSPSATEWADGSGMGNSISWSRKWPLDSLQILLLGKQHPCPSPMGQN